MTESFDEPGDEADIEVLARTLHPDGYSVALTDGQSVLPPIAVPWAAHDEIGRLLGLTLGGEHE